MTAERAEFGMRERFLSGPTTFLGAVEANLGGTQRGNKTPQNMQKMHKIV